MLAKPVGTCKPPPPFSNVDVSRNSSILKRPTDLTLVLFAAEQL